MTNDQRKILESALNCFVTARNNYFASIKDKDLSKQVRAEVAFEHCWDALEDLCEFYVGQSFGIVRIITKVSNIDISTLITKLEMLKKLSTDGKLDALIAEEEARLLTDDEESPQEPFSLFTA